MKFHKIYWLFLIIGSCKNDAYKKVKLTLPDKFRDRTVNWRSNDFKLELDSVTSPKVHALQHYKNGNNEFLVYLNEETGTLYVNDLGTKKIVNRIQVKDTLKTHNKMFQGFYYHNKDSIFLIGFKPKILLVNDSGTVLKEYILKEKIGLPRFPRLFLEGLWASTSLQPFFYGNILYLGSVVVGGSHTDRRKIQIQLNVINSNIEEGNVALSDVYRQYNFGGNNYEIYSVCPNSTIPALIYAFPQDGNVFIYSLRGDSLSVRSAQSKGITEFTEYDVNNYKKAKSDPTLEYFMTTPSYEGIYYDKFRDLYYRMALLPVEERNYNYERKSTPLKQLSIVVFDNNFNYLGEKLLEKNRYLMFSAFVSSKGINVQQRTNSDETLDFTTFSFDITY